MRKFLARRLDMVEKLGKRPVGLLLSLLSLLGFVIPATLSQWEDRTSSAGPGVRRTCSNRLRSSGKKCLARRQKLWTAIDHALACRTSHGTPYAITMADLDWQVAPNSSAVDSAPKGSKGGAEPSPEESPGNGHTDRVKAARFPGNRAMSLIDNWEDETAPAQGNGTDGGGTLGATDLVATPVTHDNLRKWGDDVDVSPPGRSRVRVSTASNTVLFCQSPDKAGAETDVEQSPSPSAFRPREDHPDSISSRPPISSWLDQGTVPPSLRDGSWKGWFRIRGDGNCAIRAVVAGLSLLGRQGWVHTIGAALGDTEEESNMVGELCSQFDGLEEAISLDQPEERLARLSALMSESDWTTAIRTVLAAKVADLPTSSRERPRCSLRMGRAWHFMRWGRSALFWVVVSQSTRRTSPASLSPLGPTSMVTPPTSSFTTMTNTLIYCVPSRPPPGPY